jgi:hypothetical protein
MPRHQSSAVILRLLELPSHRHRPEFSCKTEDILAELFVGSACFRALERRLPICHSQSGGFRSESLPSLRQVPGRICQHLSLSSNFPIHEWQSSLRAPATRSAWGHGNGCFLYLRGPTVTAPASSSWRARPVRFSSVQVSGVCRSLHP